MLVVCRECGKLVDEKQAVRMSEVGFKTFQQYKYDIPFISYYSGEHEIYTQIYE